MKTKTHNPSEVSFAELLPVLTALTNAMTAPRDGPLTIEELYRLSDAEDEARADFARANGSALIIL